MSTLKTHNLQSPDSGSVNIAMAPNAGMVVSGLSTYSNQINVGSNIKLGSAGVGTFSSINSSTSPNLIIKDGTTEKGYIGFNANDPFIGRKNGVGVAFQNNKIRPVDGDDGSGSNNTVDIGENTYKFKDAYFSGTVTANSYAGDGSNLTSLPAQATIANNADNRVITGGSGVNLNGEAGLTYNGQALNVNSVTSENNAFRVYNTSTSATTYQINGEGNSFIGHTYPRSDGNLDLGFVSGHRWRDLIVSGGVRFGASGDNHYLDDYEEGSWTPTIEGLSNTPTYHNRGGIFTKIGNRVWLQGHIQIANTKPQFTSQTAVFKLSGLPFSMSGTAGTGYFGTHGVCLWQQLDWVGSSQSTYGHNDDTQMSPGIIDGGTRISFQTCGQGVYYIGQLLNRAVHDDRSWNLEWTMHYRTAT